MGKQEQAADSNARRYESHRETSRHFTEALLKYLAHKGLMPPEAALARLTGIEDVAITAADGWYFPWKRIMGQNRPYFRRFEIALWCDGNLYGLATGRASRGPDNVTVHFLERAAADNPFERYFAQIVVEAADRYAKLIGRQRVKLRNPVPRVIPTYERLGFSVAEKLKGTTYYARQVM